MWDKKRVEEVEKAQENARKNEFHENMFLKARLLHFVDAMKEYGLNFPKLPLVGTSKKLDLGGQYSPLFEAIVFKSDHVEDGDAFAEEYGHFLRRQYSNKSSDDKREALTSEFFGYLARRMAYEKLSDKDKKVYFSKGVKEIISRKDALYLLKRIRSTKAVSEEILDKTSQERDTELVLKELDLLLKLNKLDRTRRNLLVHTRGYYYASKVDLSRIGDWEKLFSMPDGEVRRRFFTPNPDYSGLEKQTRRYETLEHRAVSAAVISSFVLSLLFLSSNITGNVISGIAGTDSFGSNFIGGLLFIFALIGAFLLFMKHRDRL